MLVPHAIHARGPSSVTANPSSSQIHLTRGASDWLWAVFAVMALSALGMIFWSHRRPRGQRVFHHLALIVLSVAAIAYYAMASNLGRTGVAAEWSHGAGVAHPIRDVFFVRYIMWFINAPLLLLLILLITGLSLSHIFTTVFFSWIVVVTGLVGALTTTRYKWGFFIMGVLALLYIVWLLLAHARTSHFFGGAGVRSSFLGGAGFLSAVWLVYPIAWACCEGSNIIGIAGEMIWYGILDLLAGPVFLLFFLHRLRGANYADFGFASGKATDNYGAGYAGEKTGRYGAGGQGVGGQGLNNTGAGLGGNGVGGAGLGNTGAGVGTTRTANTVV